MRHQGNRTNRRGQRQFAAHGGHFFGLKTQTVHAGIELQINRQAHRQRGGTKHLQLFKAIHGSNQPVFRTESEIVRIKKAFEQENWLAKTGLAQAYRIGQIQQRKAVGNIFQRLRHPQQTMPVSIGLRHRPDPGRCGLTTGEQIVVTKGGKVDTGLNRTGHFLFSFANAVTERATV